MQRTDVEDIAESLEEKYPDVDIYSLRFTLLKKMISELDDINVSSSECNERALEAIQGDWVIIREEKKL